MIVQGDSVGFDHVDRAVESTKTTLGLKLFLSLAWHGERGPGDYVVSRYDLTRRFYEGLSNQPGISCPYEPESNILCFRVEEADQLSIRDRLLADERLHIGTTTLNGKRHLRLVLMSPHTDAATLDDLLRAIAALRSSWISGTVTRCESSHDEDPKLVETTRRPQHGEVEPAPRLRVEDGPAPCPSPGNLGHVSLESHHDLIALAQVGVDVLATQNISATLQSPARTTDPRTSLTSVVRLSRMETVWPTREPDARPCLLPHESIKGLGPCLPRAPSGAMTSYSRRPPLSSGGHSRTPDGSAYSAVTAVRFIVSRTPGFGSSRTPITVRAGRCPPSFAM